MTEAESAATADVTVEFLERFGEAWNRRDLDSIMSFFTDDCAYLASFGPDRDGTPYRGHAAVREGIATSLASFPDGRYTDVRTFVAGNRGASEWTFIATTSTGERVEIRGCDLFEFKEGKIKTKDAFRKEKS